MHLLGIVAVAALVVLLGIGGLLLHPAGRVLLADAGADRPGSAGALGLLVFGLVTLPLGLGYGLRGGVVGVVFACTPSLGFAVIGGVLLRGDPLDRRPPPPGPPASTRLTELFTDRHR